jgi:hypothetical protein
MVWYGMVCMVLYRMVSYGVVWYGMVLCDTVCGVVRCGMVCEMFYGSLTSHNSWLNSRAH